MLQRKKVIISDFSYELVASEWEVRDTLFGLEKNGYINFRNKRENPHVYYLRVRMLAQMQEDGIGFGYHIDEQYFKKNKDTLKAMGLKESDSRSFFKEDALYNIISALQKLEPSISILKIIIMSIYDSQAAYDLDKNAFDDRQQEKKASIARISQHAGEVCSALASLQRARVPEESYKDLISEVPQQHAWVVSLGLIKLHKAGMLNAQNSMLIAQAKNHALGACLGLIELQKAKFFTKKRRAYSAQNKSYVFEFISVLVILNKAKILEDTWSILMKYQEFSQEILKQLKKLDRAKKFGQYLQNAGTFFERGITPFSLDSISEVSWLTEEKPMAKLCVKDDEKNISIKKFNEALQNARMCVWQEKTAFSLARIARLTQGKPVAKLYEKNDAKNIVKKIFSYLPHSTDERKYEKKSR